MLVVEGLGTSLVGAYGSNIARTPCIDQLAAQGVVLDQCYVDSLDLESQLRSLWTGRHAQQTQRNEAESDSLWPLLAAQGVPSVVITDCELTSVLAERMGCKEVLLVRPQLNDLPVDDAAACCLMNLFSAAAAELESGREGVVWIHSRGLKLPWDAPIEIRNERADPEDLEPPAEVHVPSCKLESDYDPDLVIGWGQVAAAQAAVIDDAIAMLGAAIDSRADAPSWSWLVMSLGGVPLGNHGYLGWGHSLLVAETLCTLAIIVPSDSPPVGQRRAELYQLPDVFCSLLHMLGVQDPRPEYRWGRTFLELGFGESPRNWPREFVLAGLSTAERRWMRCPAWSATFPVSEVEPNAPSDVALFVKPDDRWEVSDIADRRPDILELLEQCASDFARCLQENRRGSWEELPDELGNLLR